MKGKIEFYSSTIHWENSKELHVKQTKFSSQWPMPTPAPSCVDRPDFSERMSCMYILVLHRIAQSLEAITTSHTSRTIQGNNTVIIIVRPNIAVAIGCLHVTAGEKLLAALANGNEIFLGPAEAFSGNTGMYWDGMD